jgi:hypothetical protein
MLPFQIGNWLITEEGIEWVGQTKRDFLITKDRLAEFGSGDRRKMYDWLVHLPTKGWVTETDIYALNTALIFALEYFKIGFPSDLSFVETFIEQQNEMK